MAERERKRFQNEANKNFNASLLRLKTFLHQSHPLWRIRPGNIEQKQSELYNYALNLASIAQNLLSDQPADERIYNDKHGLTPLETRRVDQLRLKLKQLAQHTGQREQAHRLEMTAELLLSLIKRMELPVWLDFWIMLGRL